MKKIIIAFMFCLLLTSFAHSQDSRHDLIFKLGSSFAGDLLDEYGTSGHENKYDSSLVTPALTAEYFYYPLFNPLFNLGFGAGITYEFKRTIDMFDTLNQSYSYLIPYIAIRPRYKLNDFNLYALAKVGITYMYHNDDEPLNVKDPRGKTFYEEKPDVHYGFGIGAEYKNFLIEFLYAVNKTTGEPYRDFPTIDQHRTLHTYTLNIGYKIDIQKIFTNLHQKYRKKTPSKEKKKSREDLLIDQNELLKEQIELMKQNSNNGN